MKNIKLDTETLVLFYSTKSFSLLVSKNKLMLQTSQCDYFQVDHNIVSNLDYNTRLYLSDSL
jgi:hypothetical protein